MIKATEGYGLISNAQIPTNLLPVEKLSTNDINKMSTKDFAWSLSMMFTVAHLVQKLLEQGWNFKTVDVCYDTKSLNKRHRFAIKKYLQERLKTHIKNFLRGSNHEKVIVRHVKSVGKTKPGSAPDKFQMGTWLADRVVRRYSQILNLGYGSSFGTVDLTQDINEILNHFFRRGFPVK